MMCKRIRPVLFIRSLVFTLFYFPKIKAQDFGFGDGNNRATLELNYQKQLSYLIYSNPRRAIAFIDSMQKIWPAEYENPLSLKDKFLVESFLGRPDSAIKWYESNHKLNRNGDDFGFYYGRLTDSICPNLLRDALSKNTFSGLIKDKRDHFLFTEFLRKMVYFKTSGRALAHGFGAS